MPTATQQGMAAIYSGGFYPAQQGGAFGDRIKAANRYAKKNRGVTKISSAIGALGLEDDLNRRTNGKYGSTVKKARQAGYGKRKTRKRK